MVRVFSFGAFAVPSGRANQKQAKLRSGGIQCFVKILGILEAWWYHSNDPGSVFGTRIGSHAPSMIASPSTCVADCLSTCSEHVTSALRWTQHQQTHTKLSMVADSNYSPVHSIRYPRFVEVACRMRLLKYSSLLISLDLQHRNSISDSHS